MSETVPQPSPADSSSGAAQPFSPADETKGPKQSPLAQLAKARGIEDHEFVRHALSCVGETTYHWTLSTDRLDWSGNAADILGVESIDLVRSGRGYASLLDPDNFTSRFEAVMRTAMIDEGEGVPFQIEYLFRPRGRDDQTAMWLEDSGRWFAGPDGRPNEVFGVVRQVNDKHQRDQHLRFLGNCDPLTGMMNRGRMSEALGEAMSVAQRDGTPCAFLVAMISNLAVVNDAYGFDIADEVIVAVGRRLRQVVRTGDAIGRYSGAKFGMILSNCDDREIEVAAERFLSVARESVIDTDRGPVWAVLSIGGLVLPRYAETPNLAMARAEEALAEAKKLPTDGFVAYRPSAERISLRSLNARCAAEIVTSLKSDRFTLAYQPIVEAQTGEVAMHEALLRMVTPEGETIAAHHLVPIAEKLGLVRLIDRRVMMLAVQKLLIYPKAQLCLNVSGITATDPRWFGQLTEILSEQRDIIGRLTVEITETAALNDLRETGRFIGALRELGCKVAIDDFGAGYTSFRNLKVLNVDMVKLDGSFSERLAANRDNQYFIRSLIDLAQKFNLKTVAEWVQSPEDAELLKSWGVDYLQGKLFGEAMLELPWPMPEESATAFAAVPEQPEPGRISLEGAQPVPQPPIDVDVAQASAGIDAVQETRGEANPVVPHAPEPDPGARPLHDAPVAEAEDGLDFSRLRLALSALDEFGRTGKASD